ncbi:MAG: alpha-hydroxy-acid oxidizing protein, partial [Gammaproteobacteria bacterium]|nr:alpha-hydroxy-acid oxidizing protein [Gammaproteobacteria bacterium]
HLYGLAAAGQPGVTRVLDLMRAEIERGMGLIGCRKISEISARHIT